MADQGLTLSSLIAELKERHVFRTVLIYAAVAWLLIQAVDIIGPALFLPAWITTLVIVLLVLGLPIAVLLAWRFDIVGGEATRQASPEGKAATYIWLGFSVITFIGGSWLAYYSYEQTMAVEESVHASFGVYAPPDHSIAVLPFVNLSGNPDNEYFGDGLADSVLHRLAQVDQLFVIARTSSFLFKGSNENISSIGRKLNVGAVLEGSVQQIGNDMRIIAQLIDARSGEHLKSLTFDATTENLFSVQDEISLQVAEALEIELLRGVTDRLTASGTDIPKAHDLYMLGRYQAGKYTPEGVKQGHEFYKQAITLDPTFVLAYVGVADTLIRSPEIEKVPGTMLQSAQGEFSRQAFPQLDDAARYSQAKDALKTALVLDAGSAEAHASLGYLETWLGDRSVAESAFQTAIELRPGLADTHYYYGRYLAEEGRYADAREQLMTAMELDPANIPILQWNATYVRTDFAGIQAAMTLKERIAELDPANELGKFRNPTIYFTAWLTAKDLGNYVDGVAWLERELATSPDRAVNQMAIGLTYQLLGDADTAERWRRLAAESPTLYDAHGAEIWQLLILWMQGRTDDASALIDTLFGRNGDPYGLYLRAVTEDLAGRPAEALANYDRIPEPVRDFVLLTHEWVISNTAAPITHYASLLIETGDQHAAEEALIQAESFVDFFRQQGYATRGVNRMSAHIHVLRGEYGQALEYLRKDIGRPAAVPLELDGVLQGLHDYPEFQEIASFDDEHKAEQLRLLRERHRVAPPWSPDYFPSE